MRVKLCSLFLMCSIVLSGLCTSDAFGQDEDLKAIVQQMQKQISDLQTEVTVLRTQLATVQPNPAVKPPADVKRTVEIYGFANMSVIYDSNRTDTGNGAFWVRRDMQGDATNSELNMHPRLTRFGINAKELGTADWLWDANVSGKIEMDFYGGGSESRQNIRMRHGYLKLDWTDAKFSFLAGQTSDLMSPLFPHEDYNFVTWNGGNLGDRRPQVRFEWTPSVGKLDFYAGVAALRTEAVGAQDIDGDTNNDGEDENSPMLQARLAVSFPTWVEGKKLTLGISGHTASEEAQVAVGTDMETHFDSTSINVDAVIPIWKGLINKEDSLELRGEWFHGKNLNDVRGGIGQGINATTGEEISAQGGWVELDYNWNSRWMIFAGYAADNPDDDDLGVGGGVRRDNRRWYIGNFVKVGGNVQIGVVYIKMHTDYYGDSAENNRWNIFFQYNF